MVLDAFAVSDGSRICSSVKRLQGSALPAVFRCALNRVAIALGSSTSSILSTSAASGRKHVWSVLKLALRYAFAGWPNVAHTSTAPVCVTPRRIPPWSTRHQCKRRLPAAHPWRRSHARSPLHSTRATRMPNRHCSRRCEIQACQQLQVPQGSNLRPRRSNTWIGSFVCKRMSHCCIGAPHLVTWRSS